MELLLKMGAFQEGLVWALHPFCLCKQGGVGHCGVGGRRRRRHGRVPICSIVLHRHTASQAAQHLESGALSYAVLRHGPFTVCQWFARKYNSLWVRRHTLPDMNARCDGANTVLP